MANVCNQSLYIVVSCDDDMRELLVKMLNNVERRINGSDEGGRRDPNTCEGAVRKIYRFCWDADWRIEQARDRRERAEYQQKNEASCKRVCTNSRSWRRIWRTRYG